MIVKSYDKYIKISRSNSGYYIPIFIFKESLNNYLKVTLINK